MSLRIQINSHSTQYKYSLHAYSLQLLLKHSKRLITFQSGLAPKYSERNTASIAEIERTRLSIQIDLFRFYGLLKILKASIELVCIFAPKAFGHHLSMPNVFKIHSKLEPIFQFNCICANEVAFQNASKVPTLQCSVKCPESNYK